MNKCDSIVSPRDDCQSTHGNDRPFKLPESIGGDSKRLFSRTDYSCGSDKNTGTARCRNPREYAHVGSAFRSNVQPTDCTDTRCSRGTSENTNPKSNTRASNRTDARRDTSGNGGRTDASRFGSRADYSRCSRILECCCRNRPKCTMLTAEHEMKAQYRFLKEQYSRICEQESILRNQMALLNAELILMQTRTYHKSTADVRRITIDPLPLRKVENKVRRNLDTMRPLAVKVESKSSSGNRYFPPPKVINANREKGGTEIGTNTSKAQKELEIGKDATSSNASTKLPNDQSQIPHEYRMCNETGDVVNRCFYFTIPLAVVPPPYSQPIVEKVTRHRLQKLPSINCKSRTSSTSVLTN